MRGYLDRLVELHRAVAPLYDEGEVYVTAGGSANLDLVAEAFAAATDAGPRTRFVLRSGAYFVHDDGFYPGHLAVRRGGAPGCATAAGRDA